MKSYQCHKVVKAARIVGIVVDNYGDARLELGPGSDPAVVVVSAAWMERHIPRAGGYYMAYGDAYSSYAPAKDFEDNYSALESQA